ncbi:hypothetical protein ACFSJW_00625 [Flavobacterium artemisiae]|uniref:Uncharacterized protein n=1 Tax=Flavobacterium artemisiae TaxID=2126556 RepID=A0ABW4HIB4_9FLAO
MGFDIDFYRLNRETLKERFQKLEESDECLSFANYIEQVNIAEKRTYFKTDADLIIQKIKEDSLLLKSYELDDLLDYIYETAVGKGFSSYETDDERFVSLSKQFGFELIHEISRGCASVFALNMGDSDVLKGYEFWDKGNRHSVNLKKDEFLNKLDYIILLHAKLQLLDAESEADKNEFSAIIDTLENNELLKKVVENDLESALRDEKQKDNSWSIFYNVNELKSKFGKIDDDVAIFYY